MTQAKASQQVDAYPGQDYIHGQDVSVLSLTQTEVLIANISAYLSVATTDWQIVAVLNNAQTHGIHEPEGRLNRQWWCTNACNRTESAAKCKS